jgi:choline dehydrogenase-like flavoprotein
MNTLAFSDSATEIRDLRTGSSLWARFTPRSLGHRLRDAAKADVVIVGAGITGALLAHTLSQKGLSIIILDRREPSHGSIMASTALLQWEIDSGEHTQPLLVLRTKHSPLIWRRRGRCAGTTKRPHLPALSSPKWC